MAIKRMSVKAESGVGASLALVSIVISMLSRLSLEKIAKVKNNNLFFFKKKLFWTLRWFMLCSSHWNIELKSIHYP